MEKNSVPLSVEYGQTGQIKEVYIKKINSLYYIMMRTLNGDYHSRRPHLGHSYRLAKTILSYWKRDLLDCGCYYRVSLMGDVLLNNRPYPI